MTSGNKLKELEKNPVVVFFFFFDCNYLDYINKLEQLYEEETNGIKIRGKCKLLEFGEKSSKIFLNFEKQHGLLNEVRTLPCGEKEVIEIKIKLIKKSDALMKISLLKN